MLMTFNYIQEQKVEKIERLSNCLSSIVKWINAKFLKLNEDKTEILTAGNKHERKRIKAGLGSLTLQSKKEKNPVCYFGL